MIDRHGSAFYWLWILLLAAPVAWAQDSAPQNWPSWRGPHGNGSAAPGNYRSEFSSEQHVAWSAKLPGKGCNTPIVWNRQIFLTAPIDGQDAVLSYGFDGKQRWATQLGKQVPGRHRNGSGANPSLVTDGQRVYAYFKSGNFAGLDLDGKVIWKTNLEDRFGKVKLYWDLGTSPVLSRDHVIVAIMHGGESLVAAFDKKSGQLAWKTDRTYQVPPENDNGYTTPHVLKEGDRQTLLVWGTEHVTAYDAADGRLIWSCGGFNPNKRKNWPHVGSSVVVDDVLVVPYGRGAHLAGIKIGGEGDVTETNRLWKVNKIGTFVPSPSAHDGKVYIVKMRGQVYCVDPKTGKVLWKDAFPRSGKGSFYASPTIADGKLYAARDDGTVFVAQIDGGFKMLSANPFGEQIIAGPVAVEGRLLIRTSENLYCIEAP
ncbi:MAG: PQQ-binding-like beta-propeller repeat protein [Phycisphaeraceae bacterium]|nr:PQQ-binding-like beta-propeller repeat protein [Phycisphaeraceae bacterium]